MTKAHNNGLSKRCRCPRRQWTKCDHPWHFDFFKGKKFRFSLDVLAVARGVTVPRTKSAAEALADVIRSEIRLGTFVDPHHPAPVPVSTALTVGDVCEAYLVRHVAAPGRRPSGQATMRWHIATLRRTEIPSAHGQSIRFEDKPIKDVVKADLEAIRAARRAHTAATGRAGGEVGINRLLERARHLFAWAIEEGYLVATPFRLHGQVVIKLTKETPRDRRLVMDAGEEERLIQHAGPHLRDLIIAAISTGCRLGELLSLQWQDIRTTTTPTGQRRQSFVLQAHKTKTQRLRVVPVGARLAAILSMRRHAPDGEPFGPTAHVFGNAVGEKIQSIKKAWQVCVLKAHGHTPTWVKGGRNHLSPESQAAYRAIGLHFHDLRREFGSRVLESGGTVVEAQYLLGHSNPAQTGTYLASSVRALETAIDRKEAHEQRLAETPRSDPAPASDRTRPDRVQ